MNKINKKYLIISAAVLIVAVIIGGGLYWYSSQKTIYIESAEISAPTIALSPETPGTLEEIMVNPGDQVNGNTIVARVGDQLIKTKSAGLIIGTKADMGKIFNPGEAVVTMIIPNELRLIGHIEEDKGLKDIQIGQRAIFKTDAFGNKQFYGVVDEVSETANASGLAFSISDKRATKKFDVKVRCNIGQYGELKNGMSAKLWVYTN
jgi:multidrug resistance efflux pump